MKTYRINYIPQIPGKPFQVEFDGELEQAALLLNTIIDFSIFEFDNKIKPDYADMAWIEVWVQGTHEFEWEEVEEELWANE